MIEIKEEDIILDWKGMDEIHIFYTEKQLGKQLKQQILQDHEEAKECREFHYREHQAIKDRQIVKRLEEEIKNYNNKLNEIIKVECGTKSCGSDFHLRLLDNRDNLQKILEGEE